MKIPYRCLFNLYGTAPEEISKIKPLEELIGLASEGYELQASFLHQFQPRGVTFAYIGNRIQLTGHSWPEHRMIAIDVVSDCQERSEGLARAVAEQIRHQRVCRIGDEEDSQGPIGKEICGYFEDAHAEWLGDPSKILATMREISQEARFTSIGELVYQGNESRAAMLILSESHFSVHYLSDGTLWADIFTCGKEGCPERGWNLLKDKIEYSNFTKEELVR
jgi:S-adenosylmethionine/arginine decarboxylase-like enzyme